MVHSTFSSKYDEYFRINIRFLLRQKEMERCQKFRKSNHEIKIYLNTLIWYTGLVVELYKRKPNTSCFVCKKEIYRRPSEIERNKNRVFCGITCYGKSCRKERPCSVCGKLILAKFNKKTCSRRCSNTQRQGVHYRTGRLRDKVTSQRFLKIRLLKERGQKCERCSYKKFEILQVHHKDRNRNNNNLENLALICPNCHYEEHFLEKSWLKNKLEKKTKKGILD